MLRLIRFLRGSVRFRIGGRFPERFINIALKNGVTLWGTVREGDTLYSCMYLSDYLRCRALARRSSCRLRIVSRYGLPVYLRRHRDRVGVVIGAGVFAVIVFVMSLFLWSIDITGLDTVSESHFLEVLRSEGVFVGAFKPSLNYLTVARKVMLDMPEIGWMAVNVQGSHASVEVKEESPAPAVDDVNKPANIKASSDGTVVRMDVMRGDAYTTEGSGVVKGQLLVSGVVPDKLGGITLVRSDARILARTHRQATFSIPKRIETIAPTGEVAYRHRAEVLTAEFPLTAEGVHSELSVIRRHRDSAVIADITMPLSRITESVWALEYHTRKLKNNSAKEILMSNSTLYECFSLHNCTIESRDYSFTQDSTSYLLTVDYTCLEDIAEREEIGVDENTDRMIVHKTSDGS